MSKNGMIVDANQNRTKVDVYALIINNTVVNTILACYNDVLAIYNTYDYCVDVTVNGSLTAGIGSTYNAAQDTFSVPPAPPVDYVQNLEYDFDGVVSEIQQCLVDVTAGRLTPLNILASYNSCLTDNPGITPGQIILLQAVYNYVLKGGG